MDMCFTYLVSPTEKPAVKASAITILDNLARIYPDIRNELDLLLTEKSNHESPAFRARARQVLKHHRK